MNAAAPVRRLWLLPLLFFQVYLSVTVALFFWGPWPWNPEEPVLLFAYLMGAQIAIAVGYLLSWRAVARRAESPQDPEVSEARAVGFLRLCVIVTILLLVPTSLARTGEWLPDVVEGILNAGAVYNANFERLEAGNPYVVVEYVRMLLSPLLVGLVPVAIVYWSRLSRGLKIGCAISIAFHLSLYVATGTNKGLADFAVTLPWLVFLGVKTGTLRLVVRPRVLAACFLVLFVAFLAFFGAGQAQREGGVGELGVFNTGSGLIEADREDSISSQMSDSQRIVYESLARYLGQGYYALSMTFDLEHSSTYGFGHSMFLARNADAIFGTNHFTAGSLPGLLEERTNWGMMALWHSIYPWLASDLGFLGALLCIGFFAWLLGRCWGAALLHGGHWPVILCHLMLVLFFYVPANNQIFQTAETCVAFFLVLAAWAFSGSGEPAADEAADTGSSVAGSPELSA
jgi:hypothetical protein